MTKNSPCNVATTWSSLAFIWKAYKREVCTRQLIQHLTWYLGSIINIKTFSCPKAIIIMLWKCNFSSIESTCWTVLYFSPKIKSLCIFFWWRGSPPQFNIHNFLQQCELELFFLNREDHIEERHAVLYKGVDEGKKTYSSKLSLCFFLCSTFEQIKFTFEWPIGL